MYLWVFPNRDYAVGAVAGTVASGVAVFLAHPIESVKVRMQSGHRGGAASSTSWERFRGLFRRPYCGIGPHFLQYSALNSIRFGSYAAAKGFFERRHASEEGFTQLPISEIFACGMISGTCIAALLHPLFVVKTHQQINRIGILAAVQALWRGEGVRGLFRGYVSGFVRFPIALGVFFAAYEALKRALDSRPLRQTTPVMQGETTAAHDSAVPAAMPSVATWLGRSGSGAVAGVLTWTSIYPLDVVQSRMMGEAVFGQGRTYRSALASFWHIYCTEGLSSFGRGYSAVLLRSGPVNAVLFPVNDAIQPVVNQLFPLDAL